MSKQPLFVASGPFLNAMKLEVAQELGIQNFDLMDKGATPSKVFGKIGGAMTRRLIVAAEAELAKRVPQK